MTGDQRYLEVPKKKPVSVRVPGTVLAEFDEAGVCTSITFTPYAGAAGHFGVELFTYEEGREIHRAEADAVYWPRIADRLTATNAQIEWTE